MIAARDGAKRDPARSGQPRALVEQLARQNPRYVKPDVMWNWAGSPSSSAVKGCDVHVSRLGRADGNSVASTGNGYGNGTDARMSRRIGSGAGAVLGAPAAA